MDTVVASNNKFWTKKKIIWTVLGVIAIACIAFVLVQKYRTQKEANYQANMEEQILKRTQALENKDYVLPPEDSLKINKRIDELANKNYTLSPKDSNAINDRINELSQ